jgi:hypothetical protein
MRVGGAGVGGRSARIWYGNAGVGVQFVPLESREKNQFTARFVTISLWWMERDVTLCADSVTHTFRGAKLRQGHLKLFFRSRALKSDTLLGFCCVFDMMARRCFQSILFEPHFCFKFILSLPKAPCKPLPCGHHGRRVKHGHKSRDTPLPSPHNNNTTFRSHFHTFPKPPPLVPFHQLLRLSA